MHKSRPANPPTSPPFLGRGEAVVKAVLQAALEELATVGYEALCIEDVARRAGVNKTTVYRRWPTKAELVFAALRNPLGHELEIPSSGSLRDDLLSIARDMAKIVSAPIGRSLMRMMESEDKPKELEVITEALKAELESAPKQIVDAAIERGELPPDCDGEMLLSALGGTIQHQVIALRRPIDEAYLTRLVTMLLDGVLLRQKHAGG